MFGVCLLCYIPAGLIANEIQSLLPMFWGGMAYQGLLSYFILNDIATES